MRNYLFTAFLLLLLLSSCVNTQKAVYFNNVKGESVFETPGPFEEIIQENDLLSIAVSSVDPEATVVFNVPNRTEVESSTLTGTTIRPAGYLVDPNGMIKFPIIGLVKAAGLTKQELELFLRTELIRRKLLLEPVIDIRFLNYKVTVLGEVARPTVITVPSEKITLLEALGIAGDITVQGKRNNVLVIRETDGKKVTARVNLNSEALFNSPFYYLKSNDIVYVEPNKAKISSGTSLYLLLPAMISALSVVVIVFDRVLQ